ncbi:MAG: class I SAM-dependent methyltransferase [Dorea sp.]|nr:class I SAM-dependent methyltransferase [Dorea sp.]
MNNYSQITQWCQQIMKSCAPAGGIYVDATMGNGYDTAFLCKLAGEAGHVYAFDIQQMALENTRERLQKEGLEERASLILDGHEHMRRYLEDKQPDLICFNFGYLPGGDHQIATKADTSLQAIQEGLFLLKSGGMMCLCIYSGKDTGYDEKNRILDFLKNLSPRQYTVIWNTYLNRENDPPIPVFLFKR